MQQRLTQTIDTQSLGDDILLAVNGEVSSRWGYRLPTHGGNLRVRMLLVGN